jgi:hypothetical protein
MGDVVIGGRGAFRLVADADIQRYQPWMETSPFIHLWLRATGFFFLLLSIPLSKVLQVHLAFTNVLPNLVTLSLWIKPVVISNFL